MTDWRVNLEIYNGPMDLLLYLIRREEVDIHDIPIARITGQFVEHVETLRQIDPDMAGEFLVLATTLMEIKTRMLLPRPELDADDGDPIDPRADLVRQLLEYKAFKDAAAELRGAAAEQALRFPRRPAAAEADDDGADLDDVQLWDLVEAFNKLLSAVGQDAGVTEIIYDDTPIELHAADIVDRLEREGNLTFSQIFAGRTKRMELIGLFLALLELARRHRIFMEQNRPFDEIYVFLNTDAPTDVAETPAPADDEAAPPGQYVGREPTDAAEAADVPADDEAPAPPAEEPAAPEVEEAAPEGGPSARDDVFDLPELDDLAKIARIDDLTDLEGLDEGDDEDAPPPAGAT